MTTRLGPHICSKLRTKTMYLNVDQRDEADERGCSGTAIFWCLKTHECLGPDDRQATPEDCTSSRACAVIFPEV